MSKLWVFGIYRSEYQNQLWFQLVCTLADSKYANVINYISRLSNKSGCNRKGVLHLRAQLKHKRRPIQKQRLLPEFRIYNRGSSSEALVASRGIHWIQSVIRAQPRWGSWWGTEVQASLPPSVRLVVVRGGLSVQVIPPPLMESLLSPRSRPAPWATRRRRRSMASRWGWMRMGANWSCSSDSSIRELSLNSSLANSCKPQVRRLLTLRERERESGKRYNSANQLIILVCIGFYEYRRNSKIQLKMEFKVWRVMSGHLNTWT